MSLPEGVTAATLSVKATKTSASSPITVSVTVVPSKDLTHEESGDKLSDMIETLISGPGLISTLTLPHSSQAGFVDDDGEEVSKWYYIATITSLTLGGALAEAPRTKAFLLPAGTTTIDLEQLQPYTPSPVGQPVLGTQGPPGPPGNGVLQLHVPATTPDPVTVGEHNTTDDMWFGAGAFFSLIEYVPPVDIKGSIHAAFGPDFPIPAAEGDPTCEFDIFSQDPRIEYNADRVSHV